MRILGLAMLPVYAVLLYKHAMIDANCPSSQVMNWDPRWSKLGMKHLITEKEVEQVKRYFDDARDGVAEAHLLVMKSGT